MKHFILVLTLLLFAVNPVSASDSAAVLGKIEDSLYGFQYSDESDTSRITRLENTVYGYSNSGNINDRLKKIENDLSANLLGQEITPVEDTFENEEMADSDIQYPAVDELEKKIFNATYPKKSVRDRLSALEKRAFGQSFDDEDDLSARVDRLKAEIRPDSFMNNAIAQSDNAYYDGDVIELDKNYHLDRYDPGYFDYDEYNRLQNRKMSAPVKPANLASVEKSVFNQSFKNDDMESRLSRIESAMFGTEFSNDDTQTRINRISSAYKAQKSASKYDSNKFTQNMATALQLGTLILMVLACIL